MKKYDLAVLNDLQKEIKPLKLPHTLIELVKFDYQYEQESYIQGFCTWDEADFFDDWLDPDETSSKKRKKYAKQMLVFARANDTGSVYALWIEKGNTNLEKAPVIFYGDEGHHEIVAKNLKELIRRLSFSNICCQDYLEDVQKDGGCFNAFLKDNPEFIQFRSWMEEKLGIIPISLECLKDNSCYKVKEEEKIAKKAKKKFQKAFDKWQYKFYPNPKDEVKKYKDLYEKNKADLLAQIAQKPTVDLYCELSENEHLMYHVTREIDKNEKIKYLEKAYQLDVNNLEIIKQLCDLSFLTRQYEKSKNYYLKYLALNDETFEEVFYEGSLFLELEQALYQEALEIFQKIPNDELTSQEKAKLFNAIGFCYLHLEEADLDKAFENFKEAYALEYKEETLEQNIHLCATKYKEQGNEKKATEIFDLYAK